MLRSKIKIITVTFFLICIASFICIKTNYAKYDEVSEWKVSITSDTKDLEEKHEIKFKVDENVNVVRGKIAPGLKASATIKVDLSKFKKDVDIRILAEQKELLDGFNLRFKLNGEIYNLNSIAEIKYDEINPIQIITLELEWLGNDRIDTYIGSTIDVLKIPITVNVLQHI